MPITSDEEWLEADTLREDGAPEENRSRSSIGIPRRNDRGQVRILRIDQGNEELGRRSTSPRPPFRSVHSPSAADHHLWRTARKGATRLDGIIATRNDPAHQEFAALVAGRAKGVNTNKPVYEFDASSMFDVGGYSSVRSTGVLIVPIADNLVAPWRSGKPSTTARMCLRFAYFDRIPHGTFQGVRHRGGAVAISFRGGRLTRDRSSIANRFLDAIISISNDFVALWSLVRRQRMRTGH
jgi:hypothetical protein